MTKDSGDELDDFISDYMQQLGKSLGLDKKPKQKRKSQAVSETTVKVENDAVDASSSENEKSDMKFHDSSIHHGTESDNGQVKQEIKEEPCDEELSATKVKDEFQETTNRPTRKQRAKQRLNKKHLQKRIKTQKILASKMQKVQVADERLTKKLLAKKRMAKELLAKRRMEVAVKTERVPTEHEIMRPKTSKEEQLMCLVFGGKSKVISHLNQQEKAPRLKQKKPQEDDEPSVSTTLAIDSNAKRTIAWHDSDDDDEQDSANIKRNKYSHQELPETVTNERRRKQFEQIVGAPRWADLDRVEDPDSDDELLRKVGHVVKGSASQGLPKGTIELKKLKNLNRETMAEGEITSINFHPTSMVAIISGKRGLVSIVTVDGVQNEKLHTIWLPKIRIVCSRLTPDGNEAIFGSYRKFYHVYNLISGQSDTLKIPERDSWLMRNFRVSVCGKFLASAGECGEVHLMAAKSKELLRTIQLRNDCPSIAFTPDSRYLLCHTNDTEVFVYSLEQKQIVNIFFDEGCVNGSCIAICPQGQFVATGSRQGIVNIYALESVLKEKRPVPLKTINNLTTYIDTLTFNATSELLAIASSTIKNAIKLIHIQSGSVFSNFPVMMSNLGHITTAEFSPSGGYLALGNKESIVSLFRVKHYANY